MQNAIATELELKAKEFFKHWELRTYLVDSFSHLKRQRKYIVGIFFDFDSPKLRAHITFDNFSKKTLNQFGYKAFFGEKRRTFVFDRKTNKFSELVPKSFELVSRKNAPK